MGAVQCTGVYVRATADESHDPLLRSFKLNSLVIKIL